MPMMHNYDFFTRRGQSDRNSRPASEQSETLTKPSPKVVRNILNYARATQCITVKGHRLRFYLN